MMFEKYFTGDSLCMQNIQQHLYKRYVRTIFTKAKNLYEDALRIIDKETQLGLDLSKVTEIYLPSLQYMHDVIAARFRYANKALLNQYFIPGVFSNLSDEDYLGELWCEYYVTFLSRLYRNYPSIVSRVLTCGLYRHSQGSDADNYIKVTMNSFLPQDGIDMEEWESLSPALPEIENQMMRYNPHISL